MRRTSKKYQMIRPLSLNEKVEIIKEFERTKSRVHLPKLFHCHHAQVTRSLLFKFEILGEFMRIKKEGKSQDRRGPCKVRRAVGIILAEYVQRARLHPIRLSEELLVAQAKEIAKLLKLSSFKCHGYWMKVFMQRNSLTNIDWKTYNAPSKDKSLRKSLDLQNIIDDLRALKGESLIPYAPEMTEEIFRKVIQKLIDTSEPYPGYEAVNALDKAEIINRTPDKETSSSQPDSDEDIVMSSFVDSLHDDFNPMDLLCIETAVDGTPEISLKIDSYRAALSHFRPLEQYILNQTPREKIIFVVNKLGKILVKAAEWEEEDECFIEDQEMVPRVVNESTIDRQEEATSLLGVLVEFVLVKEDMRAVGLLEQLSILLKENEAR